MISVGIDWGQERHRVVVLDAEGKILTHDWFAHDQPHLAHLDAMLKGLAANDQVGVAIELHDSLLLDHLLRLGVRVYGLNPKSAERVRERFAPAGVKDDERDAWSLAEFLRSSHPHLRPIQVDSPATVALQEWVGLREDLVQERTVYLQRLHDHLVRWHPHVLAAVSDLENQWLLDLLETYPTADEFAALSHRQALEWCRGRRLRLVTRHRLADAAVLASPTTAAARNPAHGARLRHLVATLRSLASQIAAVEEALAAQVAEHPDASIFESLPYCGPVTVAGMLAGFGEDREHWRGSEELAARWGTAPVTIQSGKHRQVRRRRACDATIHQAWIWFAFNTTRKEGCWAREDYQAKRKAGCAHFTALRSIANRWVKITYRCWRDQVPYSEETYRQKRAARMQPRSDK